MSGPRWAGGWQGSIDAAQYAWLEGELESGHRSYLDRSGGRVDHDVVDRLFIAFSHHSVATMINDFSPDGTHRYLGDDLVALFHRFGNLIVLFDGHTHIHGVTPFPGDKGGFWEVTTASHIDWPQQARAIEIAVDETTGDLIVAARPLDHAGLIDARIGSRTDPLSLAGWSRELALNAWQGRLVDDAGADLGEPIGRGRLEDRDVLLVVPAPFAGAGVAESGPTGSGR